jgi:apolipoprotein N-acyltransferase
MILRIILTAGSAVLLAFSFTTPFLQAFSFVYYIPFIDALCRLRGKKRYLVLLLFYLVFWIVLVFWTKIFHFLALPSILLLFTIYLSLWLLAVGPVLDRFGRFRLVLVPVLMVGLEYFMGLGYLGFPWGPAAGSVSFRLPLIQPADLGGVALVSFLVLLANMLIYEAVRAYRDRPRLIRTVAVFGVLLAAWYGYGLFRLAEPLGPKAFRAGLVQANIDPNTDWQRIREPVMARLEYYTVRAVRDGAEFVSWAETSVMDYIFHSLRYERLVPSYKAGADFARRILSIPILTGVPLLTGLPDARLMPDRSIQYQNSAAFIETNGRVQAKYDKIHLVPFGEWFPFGRIFPFVKSLLESLQAGDYTPGEHRTIFRFRDWKFSVLICYEGVFGGEARRFVADGAQFFVNITDDMWSFNRRAHLQHAALDIFRSVENRVPFLRCGNSGTTCLIDPHGKIAARIEPLRPGYLVADVRFLRTPRTTVYTRIGDVFGVSCLGLALCLALVSFAMGAVERRSKKTVPPAG